MAWSVRGGNIKWFTFNYFGFLILEVNPSVAFVPRTANVCLFSVLSPFLAGFFNACMNLTLCRPQYSGGFHNRRGVCLVLGRKGRRKTSSWCAGRPHANSDVTIKMDSASRAPVGPQPWTLTIYGRPGIWMEITKLFVKCSVLLFENTDTDSI